MKLREKLRSRRGLTLTETLVTLLIVTLVSGAVVAGTGAAAKVYRQSVAISESQLLASTLTQAITDELRFARNVTVENDGSLHFDSDTYGSGVGFTVDEAGQVLLGSYLLLSPGAYSAGTDQAKNAKLTKLEWQDGSFQVILEIHQTGGSEPLQTVDFTVTPLNRSETP